MRTLIPSHSSKVQPYRDRIPLFTRYQIEGQLDAMYSPQVQLRIEGHADDRGSTEYNLALGNRRASALREFLTGFGLSESRFSIVSFGEERPLSNGSGEAAWARNRRGEFEVTAGANAINPGN